MMACAGSLGGTAPSTAHPGGVVAGRQRQHDRESCESFHVVSRAPDRKKRASVIPSTLRILPHDAGGFSRTDEEIHALSDAEKGYWGSGQEFRPRTGMIGDRS